MILLGLNMTLWNSKFNLQAITDFLCTVVIVLPLSISVGQINHYNEERIIVQYYM